jgi:hypothetical protein
MALILRTGIHHSPQITDPKHVCIDEWATFRFSYHGDDHIHCRPCPVRPDVPFPAAVEDLGQLGFGNGQSREIWPRLPQL